MITYYKSLLPTILPLSLRDLSLQPINKSWQIPPCVVHCAFTQNRIDKIYILIDLGKWNIGLGNPTYNYIATYITYV